MKKAALVLIGLLSTTPAHAWMASDTDTAIGIAGGIASFLGALSAQSANTEAAKRAEAAQVARATENDFANIVGIYAQANWKPGFWCDAAQCWRNYRLNTQSNGFFIAYEGSSKTDGSVVRYVCWRSVNNSPVPMRCYNTLGNVFTMPKDVELSIMRNIDEANSR